MNLHKDPSSWVKVSPKFALKGSAAQAENVLQMALDDIGRMDREILRLRSALDVIASMEPGSRGAHQKFERARHLARESLTA